MSNYKEFKVESFRNETYFRVFVKGIFGIWRSGYIATDYFSIDYSTREEAACESCSL